MSLMVKMVILSNYYYRVNSVVYCRCLFPSSSPWACQWLVTDDIGMQGGLSEIREWEWQLEYGNDIGGGG